MAPDSRPLRGEGRPARGAVERRRRGHALRAVVACAAAALFVSSLGAAPAAAQQLTSTTVGQAIAQAVGEAKARKQPATIAVVDRVGNVLGVFRMFGAPLFVTITSGRGVVGGLENVVVPDTAAAIAKAITGAYLSSNGNAFTTRTANFIIQEHFPPGQLDQPSGPLFGVQFSQLPCSDLSGRYGSVGPQRSPLGLSADPGGFPLYDNGVLVGGIGVTSRGVYGDDLNVFDVDSDPDELIALAGTVGFDAPVGIRADHITINGLLLRYSDVDTTALSANPSAASSFTSLNGSAGALIGVNGYYDASGGLLNGTVYGTAASGIVPDSGNLFGSSQAYVLVNSANVNRFAPRAGTDGSQALTAAEVQQILTQALSVGLQARSQIRQPLNSAAQVSSFVVDTNGAVLGMVRAPDAPVFGVDVALQKARTAAFFSGSYAGNDLSAAGMGGYVGDARTFAGSAMLTGVYAFTDRANGNLSRPFFPDGIDGAPNGPFSLPLNQWSIFSDGLQLDLVSNNLVEHLDFVLYATPDTIAACTLVPRLANGIQIFPGSVPIYRGSLLVGGLGTSGDGVDQDDLVSFIGLYNAGVALGTGIANAPVGIRADNLTPMGTRLRYVNCPVDPYLGQGNQDACSGK